MRNETVRGKRTLLSIVRKRLLVCVSVAFAISTMVIWLTQTILSHDEAHKLVDANLAELRAALDDASSRTMLDIARLVAQRIGDVSNARRDVLRELCLQYAVDSIGIIDVNGKVVESSVPEFVGFDMHSGAQSAEFLCLLKDRTEFAQPYGPMTQFPDQYRKFVGVRLPKGYGFVQLSFDAAGYRKSVDEHVEGLTAHWHIGEHGFVILARPDGRLVSEPGDRQSGHLAAYGINPTALPADGDFFHVTGGSSPFLCRATMLDGYTAVAFLSEREFLHARDLSVAMAATLQLAVFLLLFVFVFRFVRDDVAGGLERIAASVSRIAVGHKGGDAVTGRGNTGKELLPLMARASRRILVITAVAFVISTLLTFGVQTMLSRMRAERLISLNLENFGDTLDAVSSRALLRLARLAAADLKSVDKANAAAVKRVAADYGVNEVCVIDERGIITASTRADFVNFDMRSGAQSAEFMCLLGDRTEYAQKFGPLAFDARILRKYVGVRLPEGLGFVQLGFDPQGYRAATDTHVRGLTRFCHVTGRGFMLAARPDGVLVSLPDRFAPAKTLADFGFAPALLSDGARFRTKLTPTTINDAMCVCGVATKEGYTVLVAVPSPDLDSGRDLATIVTACFSLAIFAMLYLVLMVFIRRDVAAGLQRMNAALAEIKHGGKDVRVDERSSVEFSALSDGINDMVDSLREYALEAQRRIEADLATAKTIQMSSLPVSQPDETEFKIFARMDTAREVGGDFYDYYRLADGRLAFLVADVSDKGIPAAMFMMKAKAVIKACIMENTDLAAAIADANNRLAEQNDADMFVTAWIGIFDPKNGHVEYVNAGHNPPLVKRAPTPSGCRNVEWIRSKPSLALAAMPDSPYKSREFDLHPGDGILLYTDGVTEAVNPSMELFGEKRLEETLGKAGDAFVTEVKAALDRFAAGAEQADDITLFALDYKA